YTPLTIARPPSSGSASSRHTAAIETAKDATIAPQATPPAAFLLIRRPKLALTRKPTNGSSGISSNISATRTQRDPSTPRQLATETQRHREIRSRRRTDAETRFPSVSPCLRG